MPTSPQLSGNGFQAKPPTPAFQPQHRLARRLVACLGFAERAGGRWANVATPGRDGSAAGAPTFLSGPLGPATYCTGGSAVLVPDLGNIAAGDFSVRVAHRPRSWNAGDYATLLDKGFGTSSRELSVFVDHNGNIDYATIGGTDAALVVPTGMVAGGLYDFVLTRSGDTCTIYVDGLARGTFANAGSTAAPSPLSLGGNPSGGGHTYDGEYHLFQLWQGRCLSATEVRELHGPDLFALLRSRNRSAAMSASLPPPVAAWRDFPAKPPYPTLRPAHRLAGGLAAFWALAEGSGTRARDLAGRCDGVIQGSAPWSPGPFGPTLALDGNAQWIDVPSAPALRLTGDMTISAWINPSAVGTAILMEKGDDAAQNVTYGWGFNAGTLSWIQDNTFVAPSAYAVQANLWQHVLMTRSAAASTVTYYVNGVGQGTFGYTPASTPIVDNAESLGIGGRGGGVGGLRYAGRLDAVALWKRALSAAEAAQVYADPFAPARPRAPAHLWAGTLPPAALPPFFPSFFGDDGPFRTCEG